MSSSDVNWNSVIVGLVAGVGIGFVLASQTNGPKGGEKKKLEELNSDGPIAKEIAACIPYYPYKKIPKFYDIQGLLSNPDKFELMIQIFVARYKKMGITKVAGFDARGFLFTPVAVRLGVPFVMLRKSGKMPNMIYSKPYTKEYEGNDQLGIPRGHIVEGDKVLLIDDLIATGGTLSAGIELIQKVGAEATSCACMVELKMLGGAAKAKAAGAKDVWAFMSEDILLNEATLPEGYVDDGAAH